MFRFFLIFTSVFLGSMLWGESSPLDVLKNKTVEEKPAPELEQSVEVEQAPPVEALPTRTESIRAYVVEVTDEISKANEYILRRGIKEATREGADVLILDMDTPGGRLDVTLEMMEMLDRFEGETITYVNPDAISAGAYISVVTDTIYFAPNGVMGAAAVVGGSGQEIDESMKAKIYSYLLARMRSYTSDHPYRGDIIRAMADIDFVLEIDGEVLKPEGELLSLTADEAVVRYGKAKEPLLAEGIAEDIEDILIQHFGPGPMEIVRFETTWSENLAKFLASISPILMGLGFLALFVEFKTPGFGIFGITGILLIGIVFMGNYVAGLAGWEGILFFIFGLSLIVVDIFLLPGTFVFMIIGFAIAFGSLIFSFADTWPTIEEDGGIGIVWNPDRLLDAGAQVSYGVMIAVVGLMLVWKFLPKTPLFSRLVLGGFPESGVRGKVTFEKAGDDLSGKEGIVRTPLHPVGEVEVEGKRIEARIEVGSLAKGEKVRVVRRGSFGWIVERKGNS